MFPTTTRWRASLLLFSGLRAYLPVISQEKVRLNHERIARAEAKVDTQFQEQMSVASATLSEVETGGNGSGSVVSSAGGRTEQHRGLAIMAASESAKVRNKQDFPNSRSMWET